MAQLSPSREWFSLFEGRTTLQLQSLRDTPRASCAVPQPVAGRRRRSRVTLQALAKLVPLPPEIAELRSDFFQRDEEHAADGVPQMPIRAEGSSARSKPHEMFDLAELELPSNDNRPVMKLGELERVMSFELTKVPAPVVLPPELADLREDLEELFPTELLGLSR